MKFLETLEWELQDGNVVSTQRPYEKIEYFLKDSIAPPFAPGTYIELESMLDTTECINWSLIAFGINDFDESKLNEIIESKLNDLHKKSKNIIFQHLKDESEYFHKNNMQQKIGIYLPSKEMLDSIESSPKYLAVIFAYTKSQNRHKLSLLDRHIVVDISFDVWFDSKTDNINMDAYKDIDTAQTYEILSNLNKIQTLNSALEVILFLSITTNKVYNFNKYRIYPHISGKLVLIYKYFDNFDMTFLRNLGYETYHIDYEVNKIYINNGIFRVGEEYLDSIKNDFSIKIANLFAKGHFSLSMFNEANFEIINDFINAIHLLFDIKDSLKPKVEINETKENVLGYYSRNENLICISKSLFDFSDARLLLSVIVHEYRHFYIHYITALDAESNPNLKKNLVIFVVSIYINFNEDCKIIFKSFGNPYDMDPAEKDARLAEHFFCATLESICRIYFAHPPPLAKLGHRMYY